MALYQDINKRNLKSAYSGYFIPAIIIVGIIISLILVSFGEEKSEFPEFITDAFTFTAWINQGEDYLKEHYRWITRLIASYVKAGYFMFEDFLIDSPWIFIATLLIIPSLAVGGIRLAIFMLFGTLYWGMVGLWESAMETLALMGLSVFLSVAVGVMLGVFCALSDRFERGMKPVLDTMQVMPAFVYLIPAMFFFGIGGAPAILATMIYSMPPIIRLTNLGIRQVPDQTIESATSFGSSKSQILFKVQIPLALPSIMMGVNQTIMMALALVVLATFIGAQGLGSEIWVAIRKLDVGAAMEGGLCVLLMAIMFDRFSKAFSRESVTLPADSQKFYLLPQTLDIYPAARFFEKPLHYIHFIFAFIFSGVVRIFSYFLEQALSILNKNLAVSVSQFLNLHYFFISGILILVGIYLYDTHVMAIGTFPESWNLSIRDEIASGVKALTVNPTFIGITKAIRSSVVIYLLRPLDMYLTYLPYWFTIGTLVLISWASVGFRFAITTAVLLVFIGACGIWIEAMITLSSVLISVLLCFVIGVPIGIIASYNPRFKAVNEVVLDAMQTLPYFCYLIPVLMFFGGGAFSALLATIIYSIPPIIRLTVLGLSQVSVTYSEVSTSFGGSLIQTLRKVKFPLAVPSLVMGFNQTVMMAFAMQIVTPLIGGKGLGLEVFSGLARSDTGRSLAAGVGICLLAMIIDRISLAWTKKQRDALGI
ncbi:MAG: ABC transporter permease subunit [Pelagibacterales bacterium]|nr:ABC transporter permease subunit [Pelagibacterales bacterium]